MKTLTAKEAKSRFGRLLDLARAEPVAVTKHGLPVVVVMSVDAFDQLNALEHPPKFAGIEPTRERAGNNR